MIKFIKSFLVLGSVLFSQSSYALIDAQVLLGRRQMNLDMEGQVKDIPGSELHLAVHLDPIPLVPVAFGLSYGMINASKTKTFNLATDTDFEVKEITGHDFEKYQEINAEYFDDVIAQVEKQLSELASAGESYTVEA